MPESTFDRNYATTSRSVSPSSRDLTPKTSGCAPMARRSRCGELTGGLGQDAGIHFRSELRDNFALCISKLKGPYTENFWVCADGQKVPVRGANGRVGSGCRNPLSIGTTRQLRALYLQAQGTLHRKLLGVRRWPEGPGAGS